MVEEVRFQDQIKNLSQAVKDKQPITFSEAEAVALFSGFVDMSVASSQAQEIIEALELQLAEAKRPKLWRP